MRIALGITVLLLLPAPSSPVVPDMSSEREELVAKVGTLVDVQFAGDYRSAFLHYAGADDRISREELASVLRDASVGNMVTRQGWVRGILAALDADRDGCLTWIEFEAVMRG